MLGWNNKIVGGIVCVLSGVVIYLWANAHSPDKLLWGGVEYVLKEPAFLIISVIAAGLGLVGIVQVVLGLSAQTSQEARRENTMPDSRRQSLWTQASGGPPLGQNQIRAAYWPSGSHVAIEGQLTVTMSRVVFTPHENPLRNLFGMHRPPIELPFKEILSVDEEPKGALQSLIIIRVRSGMEYRFRILAREKERILNVSLEDPVKGSVRAAIPESQHAEED